MNIFIIFGEIGWHVSEMGGPVKCVLTCLLPWQPLRVKTELFLKILTFSKSTLKTMKMVYNEDKVMSNLFSILFP